jgi:leader peptidase (prepilin peptidase)/N-methyltransferase
MTPVVYSRWIPPMILPLFTLGLIMGSFLNVCIDRIPRNQSVVTPRSHCDFCGRPLGLLDLLPVFSFLILKGRCRYCQGSLNPRMPFVELITGSLYVALLFRFGLQWRLLLYGILTSVLIAVSIIDLEWMIIPDPLVILGVCAAMIFIFCGQGPDIFDALTGAVAGGGFLFMMGVCSKWILKKDGMGGGDIKLMAMSGLYLGWRYTLLALVFASALGGIAALALVLKDRKNLQAEMPFGPLLSIGVLCAVFFGNSVLEVYLRRFSGG